jgi:hypothetical protein
LRRGEDGVRLCDLGPAPFEVMLKVQRLDPHVPLQEHEVPQSQLENNTTTIDPILDSYRLAHAPSEERQHTSGVERQGGGAEAEGDDVEMIADLVVDGDADNLPDHLSEED